VENAGPGYRGAGSPGTGSPGVDNAGLEENAGSGGNHEVWWKTRGLVENTGSKWKTLGTTIFR